MIDRRKFHKIVLGATALSFTACSKSLENISAPEINKQRVVIVGGGFGGATAAKYLRKFSKDTEIEIFVKIRKDFEIEKFEKGMRYISFNGYGRSASTGKGQFEIIEMEQEKGFEDRKNKNSFVVLSNYIPNENDQVEVINSNIFTKKPKAYMTENPFKDYFICYNEGSYFKGNSETVKGRVLENLKKDDNRNIQCLIPFVIGVDD